MILFIWQLNAILFSVGPRAFHIVVWQKNITCAVFTYFKVKILINTTAAAYNSTLNNSIIYYFVLCMKRVRVGVCVWMLKNVPLLQR